MIRMRKIEIDEGDDGTGTVTITVTDSGETESTFSYNGKIGFKLYSMHSGYVHTEVSVTPIAHKTETARHNAPTSKFT